jgi:hypothetical protein
MYYKNCKITYNKALEWTLDSELPKMVTFSSIAQAEPRFSFEGAKLKLNCRRWTIWQTQENEKLSYNKRLQATAQSAGRFAPGTFGGP